MKIEIFQMLANAERDAELEYVAEKVKEYHKKMAEETPIYSLLVKEG